MSRPLRPRSRRRNAPTVKASASGSGPIFANGIRQSPVDAPYSPILPNLRMSRNRISRPSSRLEHEPDVRILRPPWRHDEQLAGHLQVDRQERRRRTARRRAACRAARPPRSAVRRRRRRTPRGRCRAACAPRCVVASTIVAPVIRRAEVAGDGLDLGKLGHRPTAYAGDRRERRLERQLVGLGGDRVLAGQRGHPLPVVADLDVDRQRHATAAARPPSSRGRSRPARSTSSRGVSNRSSSWTLRRSRARRPAARDAARPSGSSRSSGCRPRCPGSAC